MRRFSLLVTVSILAGCASAPAPAATVAHARPRTEAAAHPPAAQDAAAPPARMAFTGLTGTLTSREAHAALDPRTRAFVACFQEHASDVRGLGGDVTLHIVVNADGSVRTAYPSDSTIGHRGVERCLTDVARATRFPTPRGGGEAALSWPLSMDPPDGVRHPETWDPSRVAGVLARRASELRAQCGEGTRHVRVTAYTNGGRVVSVGAASGDEAGHEALECVSARVRAWAMPPSRRLAKVTFDLG
ncbi:MAG: AgmX/PglI C-terminal domain-containing protein [Sandaracinaceae bacterium]|nr:AgmX/PglI C-terminal domain-containing protein [Sandaracinaceae bacterium]